MVLTDKGLVLVVLTGVLTLVTAVPRTQKPQYRIEHAKRHFNEFLVKYNKKYENSQETERRFRIFAQNLEHINRRNAEEQETAVFDINQFADMEHDEFKEVYLCLQMPTVRSSCTPISRNSSSSPREAPRGWFDWRALNVVTKVKNQGSCGSCWAFAAVGNIEGQFAMKHGYVVELSEQQLLDCDAISDGCKGGLFTSGIASVLNLGGIEGACDYPYEASQGQCRFNITKVKAKVTNCYTYQFQSEDEIRQALYETGPLAISVDATDFKDYHGGVLANCSNGKVNHAVLLVGYGEDPLDGPYWLIKNSWSEAVGESGYIKIKRNVNACNIMTGEIATAEVA